jgi:phage terminase small subunit
MSEVTLPRAPSGLGKRGRKLWRDVVSDFTFRPDELASLESACRLWDELDRISEALRGASLVVVGQRGAVRAHPLLAEARNHRATMNRILVSLGLPADPAEEGHETLRGGSGRSEAARRMAQMRWRGSRGA